MPDKFLSNLGGIVFSILCKYFKNAGKAGSCALLKGKETENTLSNVNIKRRFFTSILLFLHFPPSCGLCYAKSRYEYMMKWNRSIEGTAVVWEKRHKYHSDMDPLLLIAYRKTTGLQRQSWTLVLVLLSSMYWNSTETMDEMWHLTKRQEILNNTSNNAWGEAQQTLTLKMNASWTLQHVRT